MNASLPVCFAWIGTPATLKVPSAAREMTTSGPSTVRFASTGMGPSSERHATVALACGTARPGVPSAASILRLSISNEGWRPDHFAVMRPMCNCAWIFDETICSMRGLNASIWGSSGVTQREIDAGDREIHHGDQHQKDFERPRQRELGATT